MPISDYQEYYQDDDFWKLVGLVRKLIPQPNSFPKEVFVVMCKAGGLIIQFRKFSFYAPNPNSLMGIKTIDSVWMFDTLLEPSVDVDVDKIF